MSLGKKRIWWTDPLGKKHYTYEKFYISKDWKRGKIKGGRDPSVLNWEQFEKQKKELAQWQEDQKQQIEKDFAQFEKQKKELAQWQEDQKQQKRKKELAQFEKQRSSSTEPPKKVARTSGKEQLPETPEQIQFRKNEAAVARISQGMQANR